MKKACTRLLSILLVAALFCSILPAALADEGMTLSPSPSAVDVGQTVTVNSHNIPTAPEGASDVEYTYTWAVPAGLSGSSTSGSITLTGVTPGSYTVSLTCTLTYKDGDHAQQTVSRNASTNITVNGIVLNPTSGTIAVGGDATITATTYGLGNQAVAWTSSDPTVATVSGGAVHGLKEGQTVITASVGSSYTATCTVTVRAKPSVSISATSVYYNTGETASALSVSATTGGLPGSGFTYQWYSAAGAIAGATSSSFTPPTATAGTTSYYCVVKNGEVSATSASATVTVLDEYAVTITEPSAATSVAAGGTLTLSATVQRRFPTADRTSYSTQSGTSTQVVWTSADPSCLQLGYTSGSSYTGSSCIVYGRSNSMSGVAVTATFTAPAGSNVPGRQYASSYTIKVQDRITVTFTKSPASVQLGGTTSDAVVYSVVDETAGRTCTYTTYPGYSSNYVYTVTYTSDNSYIATVDRTSGVVTGKASGTTNIRATVNVYYSGTLIATTEASCPVTVFEGGVEYYVSTGGSVTFDEDDFNAYFRKSYTYGTLSYVVFDMTSAVNVGSSSYGYLYTTSGSYATPITGSRTAFYYQATSSQYDLDTVTFSAGSRTGSYTAVIPFTAYGTGSNQTVQGCVYIYVNSGHSISYLGTSFRYAGIVSEISADYPSAAYVQFTLPATQDGRLYYNYSSIARYDHAVAAGNKYYLASTSTQYSLADIYFVPAASCASGSVVSISYTAYNSYGTALGTGKLFFNVSGQSSSSYFNDVTASNTGSWSANAIDFLYYNGLVSGTGTRQYSPEETMTRGMLVTMLYNAAGQPSVSAYSNPFKDVSSKDYYYKAVLWASNNGIVYGDTSTTFAPNAPVTREQIAAFLYRYAGSSGSYYNSLAGFTDSGSVSAYAQPAMRWAVAGGYISGYNNKLNPTGNATRAEVASMLHRFLTN